MDINEILKKTPTSAMAVAIDVLEGGLDPEETDIPSGQWGGAQRLYIRERIFSEEAIFSTDFVGVRDRLLARKNRSGD